MNRFLQSAGWPHRWNQFWFAEISAQRFGLLRIAFGISLVLKCISFDGLFQLAGGTLWIPNRSMWEVTYLLDSWQMPFFDWLLVPDAFWLARLEELLLVLAILLTCGLATRVVAIGTAGLFSYLFFLSQWNFHHHLFLFLLVLWILAATPCGRHFSLDALLTDPRRQSHATSGLPLRLLQGLVISIYLATFVWKCNGIWWSGEILEILRVSGSLRGPLGDNPLPLIGDQGCSRIAWTVEGLIPIGLVFRRTRQCALGAGVLLHLGIDLSISAGTFSYQMLALYVVFIHPDCGATVILYDGNCSRCARSRRWVTLLDWLQRFSWVNFRRADQDKFPLPVATDSLSQQMHLATPHGQLLTGFFAWRYLLSRLPICFLPATLLYLPPMNLLGPRIYQWFARKPSPPGAIADPLHDDTAPWQQTLRSARARHAGNDTPLSRR